LRGEGEGGDEQKGDNAESGEETHGLDSVEKGGGTDRSIDGPNNASEGWGRVSRIP
jgi:hypothetical protein